MRYSRAKYSHETQADYDALVARFGYAPPQSTSGWDPAGDPPSRDDLDLPPQCERCEDRDCDPVPTVTLRRHDDYPHTQGTLIGCRACEEAHDCEPNPRGPADPDACLACDLADENEREEALEREHQEWLHARRWTI